ncbi:MAG: hypothetical protein ACJ76Y_21425 [Thermoanaerobaculia bacterium]
MLLFAVSVAIATPCLAKCPHTHYKLDVHALDRATGAPIAQAQVLFFLPGDDSALRKAGSPSSAGLTDKAGWFTGDFLFNTYSGWWLFGDSCGAELTELELIVVPPDRPAERFHLRDLHIIGSLTDEPITLRPITIRLFPAPDG